MKVHLIENNVVVNTIEISSIAKAQELFPEYTCVNGSVGTIGNVWNGTVLTPPSEDLSKVKEEIWEEIKAFRENRVQNGGYKVGPHWYHSDTFSRTQQLGLVIAGANLPTGIKWKTLGNGYVDMTPTLALQIFMAATQSDSAVFSCAATHKAAMEASSNPKEYNWKVNWPTVFGEPEA